MDEDFSVNASIIERQDYISDTNWNTLQDFVQDKTLPALILFKEKAEENYKRLASLSNNAKIYYAVKACPNVEILKSLIRL